MVAATLYIDFADPNWCPGQTLDIDVELEEHLFRRAVVDDNVRGVFASVQGKRVMLLRGANEKFTWSPGCAVSIVVPDSGVWPSDSLDLGALLLESIGKAVIRIAEQ